MGSHRDHPGHRLARRRPAQRDHRRPGRDLRRPPAELRPARRAGQAVPGRRGHLELADHRAAAGLAEPRPGLEGLRRRRQRVRRPARRLRRRPGRPRPSRHRRSHRRPGRPGHPLRPADQGRRRGRGRTRPPLRPAPLAVRQLRDRSHHGRRPPHALDHRPGPDHQDRGLLPRPPRLGAGLRGPRAGRSRPAGPAQQRPRLHRHSPGHHRPDPDRPVQRPRQRRPAPRRAPRPGRGDDHRTGHDERRDHQARARLPGRPQAAAARPRGPAHLRRGEDRPDRRPGRGDQELRRPARPDLPGQVAGRRRGRRRHRRHRSRHGPRCGRRLRDGRHLQREPARHGRDPGHAHRGGHARGVPARSRSSASAPPPASSRPSGPRADRARGHGGRQGLRGVRRRAGPRLPRLPRRGRQVQPRALALPAQRRGLPAALGQDRAVADLRPARRGGHRPPGRRTSPPSPRPSPEPRD